MFRCWGISLSQGMAACGHRGGVGMGHGDSAWWRCHPRLSNHEDSLWWNHANHDTRQSSIIYETHEFSLSLLYRRFRVHFLRQPNTLNYILISVFLVRQCTSLLLPSNTEWVGVTPSGHAVTSGGGWSSLFPLSLLLASSRPSSTPLHASIASQHTASGFTFLCHLMVTNSAFTVWITFMSC